jgi:hypothetical protein
LQDLSKSGEVVLCHLPEAKTGRFKLHDTILPANETLSVKMRVVDHCAGVGFGIALWSPTARGRKAFWLLLCGVTAIFAVVMVIANR